MREFLKRLSMVFTAGVVGGLACAMSVWFLSYCKMTNFFEVLISIRFSSELFYPCMIWGGVWGILLVFPFLEHSIALRGIAYGVLTALVQLFIVLPLIFDKGLMGHELGRLTPFFIFFFCMVWGVVAAFWLWLIDFERVRPQTWHPPGR